MFISKDSENWYVRINIEFPLGLAITSVINCTDGVEFDYGICFESSTISTFLFTFTQIQLVTPDERKFKTKVIGIGTTKMRQEDRDPANNKLVSILTHEVDDNGQLIGVTKFLLRLNFTIDLVFNLIFT